MASTVPRPRRPRGSAPRTSPGTAAETSERARWYETELGWAVAEGPPVQLLTGVRFDVLELPAGAGAALLRRTPRTGPVALTGTRMRLLVAAGSAEELPELLEWLEWGGIALDLTAIGAGGRMTAPPPPGRAGSREAAVWLRPPVPGREVEPSLPAAAPFGHGPETGRGTCPDLVRLLATAATECHRARLLDMNARAYACTNAYEYTACEYSAD
ncbi:SCO3374 family protein [Streptomyces sp. CAU 1734]|uniref:SCO3374 family protein n=1 Tax=Streptomyces sp. CAU 1734 TaxID=3140360 RepID=UPI0032604101